MNLLYLTHRLPYPPDKGDRIRSWHILQHLAASHRVWCACLADEPSSEQDLDAVRKRCAEVIVVPHSGRHRSLAALASLLVDETATEGYYANRHLRVALDALTRRARFDAVVAFSACMAQYALRVPARRRILDLCDLDSRKWLDLSRRRMSVHSRFLAREGRLLQIRELQLYRQFDATLLISEAEATGWPLRARRRLHVVGNGVTRPAVVPPLSATGVVGFVGDMRYPPNDDAARWFARQVWPGIRQRCPDAVFRIIGREPSRHVRRLASLPGIEVTGTVKSVASELGRCQVVAAPLRIARGLQNKVLEAMAYARPVVCTPAAATGIATAADGVFKRVESPSAMIEAICALLDDLTACTALAERGERFVAEHFTWARQLAPLLRLLDAPAPRSNASRESADPRFEDASDRVAAATVIP